MKLLTALLAVLALSGCASGCREACIFGFGPGNAVFDRVALHYDTQDACQHTGKPAGYELPGYCGASRGRRSILDRSGHTIGYVK